ncbi:MAG: damage-control phosphatase ARMT1 family protein [Candidatus Asgardarchaeia archaeon]
MKVSIECVPCTLRQLMEYSKEATDDLKVQEKVLREFMKELLKVDWEMETFDMAYLSKRILEKVTGVYDPFKRKKREFNRRALELIPKVREKIVMSDDKLEAAIRLAVAGNVIDLAPGKDFNVERTVDEVMNVEFKVYHYDELKDDIERARKVIYLCDNTGEIVFDKVVISMLRDMGKEVICYVRNIPIINDATVEDALEVGLDEVAEIRSADLTNDTEEGKRLDDLKSVLKDAEVVISKGQGNFEMLYGVEGNIYFLFRVKCTLAARYLGLSVGDYLILKNGRVKPKF